MTPERNICLQAFDMQDLREVAVKVAGDAASCILVLPV